MGEAKRRKLAGYVPETKNEVTAKANRKIGIVGHGGMGMAMIAAMLADYPQLPKGIKVLLPKAPEPTESTQAEGR